MLPCKMLEVWAQVCVELWDLGWMCLFVCVSVAWYCSGVFGVKCVPLFEAVCLVSFDFAILGIFWCCLMSFDV